MSAYTVEACRSVGDFPAVHVGILIILNKAFSGPVQSEKVCISDLTPAAPLGLGGGVHSPYVGGAHIPALRSGCAVDNQIL